MRIFFFWVLEIELKALCLLAKRCTTKLNPQPRQSDLTKANWTLTLLLLMTPPAPMWQEGKCQLAEPLACLSWESERACATLRASFVQDDHSTHLLMWYNQGLRILTNHVIILFPWSKWSSKMTSLFLEFSWF